MTERDCGYEHIRPSKKGVIFVIPDGWGHILLELRTKNGDSFKGFFLVPGGGVEDGETPESTLVRETKEECGINVQKYRKIGEITTTEDGISNTRYVFAVESFLGRIVNIENKNIHLLASPQKARLICKHEVTEIVLDLYESYLSSKADSISNRL